MGYLVIYLGSSKDWFKGRVSRILRVLGTVWFG